MKSPIPVQEEENFVDGFVELLPLSTPFTIADNKLYSDLEKAPKKKQKSKSRRNILKLNIGNTICKKLDFSDVSDEVKDKKKSRLMTALKNTNLDIPLDELYDKLPTDNNDRDKEDDDVDLKPSKQKKARVGPEIITSPAPETPTYDWKFNITKVPIEKDSFTRISGPGGCGSLAGSKKLFNNLSSSPNLLKQTLKSENTARNLNLMLT